MSWTGDKKTFYEVLALAVMLLLAIVLLDQVSGVVYKAVALTNLLGWVGAFIYVKLLKNNKL